jgi:hypothetical protein
MLTVRQLRAATNAILNGLPFGSQVLGVLLRAHQKGLEMVYQVQPDAPDALVSDAVRLLRTYRDVMVNALTTVVRTKTSLFNLDKGRGAAYGMALSSRAIISKAIGHLYLYKIAVVPPSSAGSAHAERPKP